MVLPSFLMIYVPRAARMPLYSGKMHKKGQGTQTRSLSFFIQIVWIRMLT